MFTGIIEETGTIKEFRQDGTNALVEVECQKVLEGTKLGDSIAIEGICQTVIELDKNSFSSQISSETLKVTNFSSFKPGKKVNLERALTLSSRLGGHIVSGHVDGLAKVKEIKKLSDFYEVKFELEKVLSKYVAHKGSVTVNGISLTVAGVSSNEFWAAIIPHTFENTSLKYIKNGDFVNLEVDILAKYVEKFLSTGDNKVLDENFLKENGFM